MQFIMEKKKSDWPGRGGGGLASGRTSGKGTKYGPGGPSGSGGDKANAGPNGTTDGPAGQRITGFHGEPKGANVKGRAWEGGARGGSNPMKR